MLRHWEYYFQFSNAPTTTDDVSAEAVQMMKCTSPLLTKMVLSQELQEKYLETFEGVSQAHDAKDASGNSNYYADVIYRNSKFIYWIDHISTLSDGLGKTGQTFDNTVDV